MGQGIGPGAGQVHLQRELTDPRMEAVVVELEVAAVAVAAYLL